MSLLGGVASPIGSTIGTGLLILIPEWLRFLKSVPGLYLAIYGLFVILIIRFMPDGIWGFVASAFARWRAQIKTRAGNQAAAIEASNRRRRHRARGQGPVEAFRRPEGGRWRRHRGEARRRARADRPEWLRQDHDVERALGALQGHIRSDPARRHRHHRRCRRTSARRQVSGARSRTSACSVR